MPDNTIFKQYIAETKVDDEERTVTAIISTSAIDRDQEVLLPKGIQIENFMKNPVVLWAHDYSDTPIGKALYIDKKRKAIIAKVQFPKEGTTAKSDEVYNLFKGGFLNAFSVGFIPLKSHKPEPDEIKKKPEWAEVWRVIDEWELLEFSAVPVPANPEALATAVKTKSIELTDETKAELGIEEEKVEQKTKEETKEVKEPVVSAIVLNKPKILVPMIMLTRVVPIKRAYNKYVIRKIVNNTIRGKILV